MRRQKTLTIMFTDISGFTRHTETITRDELMARLDQHNALLMPIVKHFEGRIVKSIGDALMIVFESPTNAVQCGMLMQHRLAKYNDGRSEADQIHIKVSLNAGEVTVTENDVFGDCVNVAAKIEKATRPDEIYFTESVFLAMNKAEVPNVFVKNFRPKGESSNEIKLYKVIQDADDERYRRVIRNTSISDADRDGDALPLAELAAPEIHRGPESLADILAGERAQSRRTTLLATLLGALLLGGLVLGGLAFFGDNDGPSEADRTIDAVRAYLAQGNESGAQSVVNAFRDEGGDGAHVDKLNGEIEVYRSGQVVKQVERLLDENKITEAFTTLSSDDAARVPDTFRSHVGALYTASKALREGELEKAGIAIKAADRTQVPVQATHRLAQQIEAADSAWSALEESDSIDAAERATNLLVNAFGADTTHPVATRLLGDAVVRSFGAAARSGGMKGIRKRFDETLARFPGIKDRTRVRREVQLQALWMYTTDHELRSRWRGRFDQRRHQHLQTLRDIGKDDPDFLFRLGVMCHRITRKNQLGLVSGESDIRSALEKHPEWIKERADILYPIQLEWLKYATGSKALVRELLADPYKERVRDHLHARAFASYGGDPQARPRSTERANALSILVAMGEPVDPEQCVEFFTNNWSVILTSADQLVSLDDFEALVSRPLPDELYDRLASELKRLASDIGAKVGPFASYTHAGERVGALRRVLRKVQPDHAKRFEEK